MIATKTFNPMDEGARPRPRPRAHPAPGRRRAFGGSASSAWRSISRTSSTPTPRRRRRCEAFDELVEAGKVGAVGASNFSGEQLAEALELSALEGLPRYEWVQNGFSLLEQGDRETVFPVCREHGLGYTPFSPLAGGWLTGKYRRGEEPPAGSRMTLRPEPYEAYRTDRVFDALERLEARSRRARRLDGRSRARLGCCAVAEVTAIVVGPGRADHLAPAVEALSITLTADERDHLTEVFA